MDDIKRFTEGDCWILMKRLHRVTGWPCHSFLAPGHCPCIHGFVQRPDGLFLDVEGLWTRRKLWKEYEECIEEDEAYNIVEFPLSAFRWAVPEFGDYSYQRARVIADRLLDKYGSPWYST